MNGIRGMRVGAKLVEVIPEKCTGCHLCAMACSFHHEKASSVTKSCVKILSSGEWAFDCPHLCLQCPEAPCIEGCPNDALYRDRETGVVLVRRESCVGCGECIERCPVLGLALDEEKGIIFKCDLCGGDPECVKWCSKGALTLVDHSFDSETRKSTVKKASNYLQGLRQSLP